MSDTTVDVPTLGEDDDRTKAIEYQMREAGVATHEKVQVDYFAFEEVIKFVLPDGISFIQHQVLNEGKRGGYLKAVNKDVRVQKVTGDAFLRMATGDDKIALLKHAIVGWSLTKTGRELPFSVANLDTFLKSANPKIIDLIHKDVTRHNPWLLGEMTVEDVDREIEALQTMRQTLIDEAEGKAAS